MKIALITDGIFPYVIGGMQKHSFYIAKYLAKKEIYVDLFHFNQSNLDISKLECFEENEKKYINSVVVPFPKMDTFPGHYIRESYKHSELIFERIKNLLHTYDFIYTKGFTGWKLIEEKSKGLKCPIVGVKFHGYEMFQEASLKQKINHFILKKPVKWINLNADFIFSYGSHISEIIKKIGVSENKIIEIPSAIDESWLNNEERYVENKIRKFVFIGRYETRKGIRELNIVLKKILTSNDVNFQFDFIGPIPPKNRIISSKVIYHGEMRDVEAIKLILKNADVLVCPSHSEGMPNVIMEAMASRLAIVATDVGATSLLVSDKNGFLIKSNSLKSLEKSILDFIRMPENLLKTLKQNSFQKIKNEFMWEQIIDSLIEQIKLKIQ